MRYRPTDWPFQNQSPLISLQWPVKKQNHSARNVRNSAAAGPSALDLAPQLVLRGACLAGPPITLLGGEASDALVFLSQQRGFARCDLLGADCKCGYARHDLS